MKRMAGMQVVNGLLNDRNKSGERDCQQRVASSIAECEGKKRRRTDRYDSSESSDSGIASIACSDSSSWSSSSDITEPVSPASPSSPPVLLGTAIPRNNQTKMSSIPIATLEIVLKPTPIVYPSGSKSDDCNALLALPTDIASKRCRRYSDPSATQLLNNHKIFSDYDDDSKQRVRRLSGSESTKTLINPLECCKNSKGRPSPSNSTKMRPQRQRIIDVNRRHLALQRQSCPFVKCLHQITDAQHKNGQLKITEFFQTQVKHHWSYPRFTAAEVAAGKGLLHFKNPSGRLPSQSRIAIVSVAHIDQINTESKLHCQNTTSSSLLQESLAVSSNLDCNYTNTTATVPQIRFPVDPVNCKNEPSASSCLNNIVQCLWRNCSAILVSGQSLLEHIQNTHVASQALTTNGLWSASSPLSPVQTESNFDASESAESYSCNWEGCKVQGRMSSSRAWLERHVLSHGGHKPFRCIVELCEQRFNSQAALQRHVNAHFNQEAGQNNGQNGFKRDNALASKMVRRNSKKMKNRRNKVSPARLLDYFDVGIMERLRHQLLNSSSIQQQLGLSVVETLLTVHSQVIARRLDVTGKSRVLLRWSPENVLPDQWVMEEEVVTQREILVQNLNSNGQVQVRQIPHALGTKRGAQKQRRK